MPKPCFAQQMQRIQASASSLMSQRAREMKAAGLDVIALSAGQPDFPTPQHVIEAAHAAAIAGDTKYTTISGSTELKDAVIEKFRRDNGLSFSREEIIIGNGSKQVIFNALTTRLDHGDEVIVPAPYYIAYQHMIAFNGARTVAVPCGVETGFKLSAEQLEAAITPRTRWLMLNSPNNPTGAVHGTADLRALADVLLRHPHVGIIMDDIYEHIIFDEMAFTTMINVEPALRERTVIANGVSKAYAMTGWRVGFAAASASIIREMAKLQSLVTSGASSIGQAAAVAALTGPQDFVTERTKSFEIRRDLVVSMINQAKGLSCPTPNGAFYVYPSCAGVIGRTTPEGKLVKNDRDFVDYLLDSEGVATVHGAAYGVSPYFRISYASSREELEEACSRIQRACAALI